METFFLPTVVSGRGWSSLRWQSPFCRGWRWCEGRKWTSSELRTAVQGPADSAAGPSRLAGYLLFVHPAARQGPDLTPVSFAASLRSGLCSLVTLLAPCPELLHVLPTSSFQRCLSACRALLRTGSPGPRVVTTFLGDLPQPEDGERSASLSSFLRECSCLNFFPVLFSLLLSVFSLQQFPGAPPAFPPAQ